MDKLYHRLRGNEYVRTSFWWVVGKTSHSISAASGFQNWSVGRNHYLAEEKGRISSENLFWGVAEISDFYFCLITYISRKAKSHRIGVGLISDFFWKPTGAIERFWRQRLTHAVKNQSDIAVTARALHPRVKGLLLIVVHYYQLW